MSDGSPTSGGAGDALLTVDTYADTGSGTPGLKIAVGGLRRVVLGRDLGDVGPVNELDVQDARLIAETARQTLSLRQALEILISRLESPITVQARPAKSVKTRTVPASTSSTWLLEPAFGRIHVLVYNDATGTGNLYLSYGSDPAGVGAGLKSVRLVPGAYYEVPSGLTERSVTGIWDTASGFCDITEAY